MCVLVYRNLCRCIVTILAEHYHRIHAIEEGWKERERERERERKIKKIRSLYAFGGSAAALSRRAARLPFTYCKQRVWTIQHEQ